MFGAILSMIVILLITYFNDFKILLKENNKKQLIIYVIILSIGYVGTSLYLINPSMPGLLQIVQGQMELCMVGQL